MSIDFQGNQANVDLNQVANLLEQSTLQNLRGVQHLDANGNPISTLWTTRDTSEHTNISQRNPTCPTLPDHDSSDR